MKVKISQLKPNPFRDMKNYPINSEKIETLKNSISRTGFWDNILARERGTEIQIAYGHHRLVALKDIYPSDHMIDIPVKDLSDELMLKIMANENMDDWSASVSVIDETVRAVREFLRLQSRKHIGIDEITDFVGWDRGRIQKSILRINAQDDDGIDKKAVEFIPRTDAATTFTSKAKAHGLNVKQQRKVAKKIAESENFSPELVTKAVMDEAYPKKENPKVLEYDRQKEKLKLFDDFLADLTNDAIKFKDRVAGLKPLKADILDFSYDQTENRGMLILALDSVKITIENLLNELKNE